MKEMVDGATRVFIVSRRKAPSAVIFGVRLHDAHGQDILETFELPCDKDSMGEGAEEAHVEMIAVGRGRKGLGWNSMPPRTRFGWRVVGHDSG